MTHTLFGAAFADAGLGRRTALGTATLVVAASLPDVDGVLYFVGQDEALFFRRGWTHGVLAMVVLPVLLAAGVLAFDRVWRRWRPDAPRPKPRELLLLAAIGVWSHPLLDWLNTYGVRFLMPFDGSWFYGDTLFIVDPWIWLLLGGCLFLRHSRSPRSLWRWVALATVASGMLLTSSRAATWGRVVWLAALVVLVLWRRWRPVPGVRRIRGALLAATAYIALMGLGSVAAHRIATTELADDGLERLMVGPMPLDPFHRMVVAELHDEIRFGRVHFLRSPRFVLDAKVVPKLTAPAIDAALGAPCVRGLVGWKRYPFYEIDPTGDGTTVWILDARYVRGRTREFGGAAVHLDRSLRPTCPEE